jgi:hypothetical protein
MIEPRKPTKGCITGDDTYFNVQYHPPSSSGSFALILYMTGAAIDQAFPNGSPGITREQIFCQMAFAAGLVQVNDSLITPPRIKIAKRSTSYRISELQCVIFFLLMVVKPAVDPLH